MNIENIIDELLSNNNNRSYAMIETLVFKVLTKYIEDDGKKLLTDYRFKNSTHNSIFRFDAYAPNGFSTYQGATIFELKAYRNKNSLMSISNTLYKLLGYIDSVDIEIKNIIFIVTLDLSEDYKVKLKDNFQNGNNVNVELWDLSTLRSIFNKYPELVKSTIDNISELVLNHQLYESINYDSYYNNNKFENHLSNLRKCFFNDELVLFLGAGISIDAKIPTWDNLVSDLLVSLLSNKLKEFKIELSYAERDFIINNLKNSNGNSPLLLARYIRQGLKEIFIDTLTQILYKSCVNESSLLNAITKLCKPVRNGIGIRGVVNYNFDDLVEYNFLKHDINYRSIFREGDIPTVNELGIYHVHGFLPRTLEEYSNLSKSLLVFSEEGYHNLTLDPYNWSNLIQLNYLRENTCLFIGLSLTDPNLRRLLDIASRKQESDAPKHYAILKRELYHNKKHTTPHINFDNIQKFDTVNQKLQEEYFKELGLNILWVDDYNQIPSILDKIRS